MAVTQRRKEPSAPCSQGAEHSEPEHCVKGKARDDAYCTVKGGFADSSVVRVSMDFGFLTEESNPGDGPWRQRHGQDQYDSAADDRDLVSQHLGLHRAE